MREIISIGALLLSLQCIDAQAEWQSQTKTSAIDDSQNVTISTPGLQPIYDRFNRAREVTLVIQCGEGSTDVYVVFGGAFMSDHASWGTVKTRIDKEKAREISMETSTDNQALGLWRGKGISLIKTMINRRRLLVVATLFNESSVDVQFDISDIEKPLVNLRKACAW